VGDRAAADRANRPIPAAGEPVSKPLHIFDVPPGHTTTNTLWNKDACDPTDPPCYSATNQFPPSFTTPPYDIDGDPSTFSDEERLRIIAVWRAAAEAYALFDADVTTGGLRVKRV
jgi:hypothetical protein